MNVVDTVCFEGVFRQCVTLAHIDLSYNGLYAKGEEILFRELSSCTGLTHHDFRQCHIGDSVTDSLGRVLVQCPALVYVNLRGNFNEDTGAERRTPASLSVTLKYFNCQSMYSILVTVPFV